MKKVSDVAFAVIMIATCVCAVVLALYSIKVSGEEGKRKSEFLLGNLELDNVEIIRNAWIESPSVIIRVTFMEVFLEKVQELNAEKVYISPRGTYYVFTEDYQIAYRIRLSEAHWRD